MAPLDFEKPLAELVEEDPRYLMVLGQMDTDSELALGLSLADCCRLRGIAPEQMEVQWEACAALSRAQDESVLAGYGIPELVGYILFTHHDYMSKELPRMGRLLEDAIREDGGVHPELFEFKGLFRRFQEDLTVHMAEEERILFPFYLMVADSGRKPVLDQEGVEMLMAVTRYEDEEIRRDLSRLRERTRQYHVPRDAGGDYRQWIIDLRLLEIDLRRHIRVEGRILFPKVVAEMVRGLAAGRKAEYAAP